MRKAFSTAIALGALLSFAAQAQKPTIDIRRVHTLVDRDGRGFVGLPREIIPVAGGWFLLMEDLPRSPAILDSTGRLVRALGRVGEGPGELAQVSGPFRRGTRDTVFVSSGTQLHVYGPDLRLARSVRPQINPNDFILTPTGFIIAGSTGSGPGNWTPFHVTDRAGKTLRSFGRDTARYPTQYLLAPAANGFWAAQRMGHRFERWTLDGMRAQVIDHVPAWWKQIKPGAPDPFTLVRGVREASGVLWVISMIPVPNIREVMRAAGEKSSSRDGSGGPPLPMDKMYTAMLEAYDARTGKPLAELAIPRTSVTVLDDAHIMLYTVDAEGLPQLEIWEMNLKRQ